MFFKIDAVTATVHQLPNLLALICDDERRQRLHLDDVRCPVCQAAPEMTHAAGYACAGEGRWFGTLGERRALRSASAAEAIKSATVRA